MKKRIRYFSWAIGALIFIQAEAFAAGSPKDAPRLSARQVRQMQARPDVMIVDVRRLKNWWRSTAKIPAAVREDPATVSQWACGYPKNRTLIFYCA